MHDLIVDLPRSPAPNVGKGRSRLIHIIFHVPRCAGQTVHHHLTTYAAAGSYHRLRKRKGVSRFFSPRYQTSGMPHPQGLKVISGHWIGRSIEGMFDGRSIARCILLRDPVSQFVSYYNFRMMRYISQGLRPYPPEIAYRARQQNFLTHYVLRNFAEISWPRLMSLSATEKYAEANRFLSDFWFVGDHTRCSELITALAPALGTPAEAEPRNTTEQWRERVEWKPLQTSHLSDDAIEQIKQDNMLDQLLWETWKDAKWGSVRAPCQDIAEEARSSLLAAQSLRLFNQVKRRLNRGWKVPVHEDTAVAPPSRVRL